MQRREMLIVLGGLIASTRLQAKTVGAASLIHDLPRTEEALFDLTQGAPILPTTQVELIAQPWVEFSPRWPVRVVSRLPGVHWMALVVEQNPNPLAAVYRFKPGALTEASSYLKIADSSQVSVVVAADSGFYGLRRFIKVVGHCL